MVYAIEHPERVTELVMRGIFLIKQEELDFFFQEGTSMVFPDAYVAYSDDKATREAAAKYWTTWEMSTSFAQPNVDYIAKGEDPKFAAAFARIETHYFVNLGFLPTPNHILENIDKIRHIP